MKLLFLLIFSCSTLADLGQANIEFVEIKNNMEDYSDKSKDKSNQCFNKYIDELDLLFQMNPFKNAKIELKINRNEDPAIGNLHTFIAQAHVKYGHLSYKIDIHIGQIKYVYDRFGKSMRMMQEKAVVQRKKLTTANDNKDSTWEIISKIFSENPTKEQLNDPEILAHRGPYYDEEEISICQFHYLKNYKNYINRIPKIVLRDLEYLKK